MIIGRASGNAVFWPLVAARVASLTVLPVIAIASGQSIWPSRRALLPVAIAGAFDAGGNAFLVMAAHAGRLDVAAVLSSLYPAGTVLLAWLILKERITPMAVRGTADRARRHRRHHGTLTSEYHDARAGTSVPLPAAHSSRRSGLAHRDREGPVRLKLESELPTGSFKVRGAIYALSVNQARRAIPEVVASSTGNHGAAVAYAARLLGVRATIFLPADPNPVKRANIARQGAEIVEQGNDLAQAFLLADAHARRTGALFLNDATDADIPDGAGTIADEIVEECPDVAAIYVPVGDTALIRGVAARAKALKPSVRIIGVQAARAPSVLAVVADAACRRRPRAPTRLPTAWRPARRSRKTSIAFARLVDDMRLVTEDAMVAAVGRLALRSTSWRSRREPPRRRRS